MVPIAAQWFLYLKYTQITHTTIHLVNIYHIAVIIYEKRPVKMSSKEKELYETMFRGLSPVEFLKITKIAQWKKFKSPLPIIQQGKPVNDLILIG